MRYLPSLQIITIYKVITSPFFAPSPLMTCVYGGTRDLVVQRAGSSLFIDIRCVPCFVWPPMRYRAGPKPAPPLMEDILNFCTLQVQLSFIKAGACFGTTRYGLHPSS